MRHEGQHHADGHGRQPHRREGNAGRADTFGAFDPTTGQKRDLAFTEATPAEVEVAVKAAVEAFRDPDHLRASERPKFIDAVDADAASSSGLSVLHLRNSRPRTSGQQTMFARGVE